MQPEIPEVAGSPYGCCPMPVIEGRQKTTEYENPVFYIIAVFDTCAYTIWCAHLRKTGITSLYSETRYSFLCYCR